MKIYWIVLDVALASARATASYCNKTNGPPMGSGHFPDENDKKFVHFKHIKKYTTPTGHPYNPIRATMIPLSHTLEGNRFQP
jgi:hypothetical protein